MAGKSPENTLERFWNNVWKGEEIDCWIWTGTRLLNSYGKMTVNNVEVLSHRLSWEIHYGEIPEGMEIMHLCDNPCCINPDHLQVGTHTDNMRDMGGKNRNRLRKGTLKPGQVNGIRRLYGCTPLTVREIAKEFDVKPCRVHAIISGFMHSDVPCDPLILGFVKDRAKRRHRMGLGSERLAA